MDLNTEGDVNSRSSAYDDGNRRQLKIRNEQAASQPGFTRRAFISHSGKVIGVLAFGAYIAPQMSTIFAQPAYAAITGGCPWPTAADLCEEVGVVGAMNTAWANSNADNYLTRHEEGFWIIQDCSVLHPTLRTVAVPKGSRAGLAPGADPSGPTERAVGFFHTHPSPDPDEFFTGWTLGPSPQDIKWHTARGLHGCLYNHAVNPPPVVGYPNPPTSNKVTF